MTVTQSDLARLASEIMEYDEDGPGWLERRTPLELPALVGLVEASVDRIQVGMCCVRHLEMAITEVVGQAFRIGWEARDQFGPKREGGDDQFDNWEVKDA